MVIDDALADAISALCQAIIDQDMGSKAVQLGHRNLHLYLGQYEIDAAKRWLKCRPFEYRLDNPQERSA